MREIEFRAWDIEKKKYHYPKLWDNTMPTNWEKYYVLEQYTGLKDINGKKIFENDIVKWGHIKHGEENPIRIARVDLFPSLQFEIVQNRKSFFKRTFEYGAFMYQDTEKWLEVIGNIHDNPELLQDI